MSYYISAGQKTMMYTLRHVYIEKVMTEEGLVGVERDGYCCNLSIDWDKAVKKATSIAGDDLDLTASFTLEDIKRLNAEELAAHNAKQKELDELYEQNAERNRIDQMREIANSVWPFGMYRGQKFNEAENSYILFMGNLEIEIDPIKPQNTKAMIFLQEKLKEHHHDLFNMPAPNGEYFESDLKRTKYNITVIEKFGFETFYGFTTIMKMVKDSGELIVYMGGACPDAEIGDKYAFMAGIKKHEEYKGIKQTFVQRITKWEKLK